MGRVILIAAGLLIAGCGEPSSAVAAYDGTLVRTWTDPETGCHYLVWSGYQQGGITARLRPDGTPFCAPVGQEAR